MASCGPSSEIGLKNRFVSSAVVVEPMVPIGNPKPKRPPALRLVSTPGKRSSGDIAYRSRVKYLSS